MLFFDGDALESACLAGCGLTQLPTSLAGTGLRSGTLVRVTVDEPVRLAATAPDVFDTGECQL